jgi:hypothetical protein
MWTVRIENHLFHIHIKNSRIQSTTLRPIIVDRTSLTIVKDASPRQILELPISILIDNEEILEETKAPYPDDI